jgi:hypothetical protein
MVHNQQVGRSQRGVATRMLVICFAGLLAAAPAPAGDLGLPADCNPGINCFVQQYPDMDLGPGAVDPFCGTATYDGHDGTDLRVLSMVDVESGVPVLAMADGTVLRLRDGEVDQLVTTEADREVVAGKDCGNGLVIDHGNGTEVQYCHLRKGSVSPKPGDTVKRGEPIARIGASGLAQFPHVHITVRVGGQVVDPSTGRKPQDGCGKGSAMAAPLFSATVADALGTGEAAIMAMGLTGDVIDHEMLSVSGPPADAHTRSSNRVGWAWFINLHQGDRIRITLRGPDGAVIAEQTSEPMERHKADYSAYSGKRGSPEPGIYRTTASVLRNERVVTERTKELQVR